MTTAKEMLRHTLATLAYRGGKAVCGAPEGFAAFKAAATTRTPAEIVAGRVGPEQAEPRREFD